MHAVTISLVLIALSCSASIMARVVRVPLPFLQIAVGVVAGSPPLNMEVTLNPEAFLLLFIPPLLFGDGWNMPRRELLSLRWPVLGHAVGLVLFTVVAGGYALHWLVPSMPLSVAFAVAALVSPTDAVALSAITERIRMPHQIKHLLESEALLNDASGLVAMRFAVGATLSGVFSLPLAAGSFLVVAAGGLALGWGLTLCFARAHRAFLTRPQDAPVQTVLSGLLPFAAYALADQLGLSGILAAVAAGMAASRVSLLEHAHYKARLQTGLTWNVVSFCLNGVIFVLLGLQLPGILGAGPAGIDLLTTNAPGSVLGEVVALTALLIVLRLVWVLASAGIGRLSRGHRPMGWRIMVASSLAGVRGMVTLAGVLSLPLLLPDGRPFPSRDLAITLATGVILSSMLVASIGLPLLLRDVPGDEHEAEAEDQAARIAAANAAIRALDAAQPERGPREAILIAAYRQRLASLHAGAGKGDNEDVAWRELHRTALHAERRSLQALRASNDVSDVIARRLLGELDLLEAALAGPSSWYRRAEPPRPLG